jgi:hypothetical protein
MVANYVRASESPCVRCTRIQIQRYTILIIICESHTVGNIFQLNPCSLSCNVLYKTLNLFKSSLYVFTIKRIYMLKYKLICLELNKCAIQKYCQTIVAKYEMMLLFNIRNKFQHYVCVKLCASWTWKRGHQFPGKVEKTCNFTYFTLFL